MELINKKDALHAVLHNQGDAAVAAVQNIKPINPQNERREMLIKDGRRMTNAELISMVRSIAKHGVDWRINEVLNRAAAALEAAEKRIAELMPKEGEWIDEQRGRWIYAKCNLCGKVQDVRSNYCPNCGARMETVTDCHTLEERER